MASDTEDSSAWRYPPPLNYAPRIATATTLEGFVSPHYVAMMFGTLQTTGVIRYGLLFVVFQPGIQITLFIVSSELMEACGVHETQWVLSMFWNGAHQTLHSERGDWSDAAVFKPKALAIAREKLGESFLEVPEEAFKRI